MTLKSKRRPRSRRRRALTNAPGFKAKKTEPQRPHTTVLVGHAATGRLHENGAARGAALQRAHLRRHAYNAHCAPTHRQEEPNDPTPLPRLHEVGAPTTVLAVAMPVSTAVLSLTTDHTLGGGNSAPLPCFFVRAKAHAAAVPPEGPTLPLAAVPTSAVA